MANTAKRLVRNPWWVYADSDDVPEEHVQTATDRFRLVVNQQVRLSEEEELELPASLRR